MRRFELGDRRWAIEVFGDRVRLVWGQEGHLEQRHERQLASGEAAAAYARTQIAKQVELGFVEVTAPADDTTTQNSDEPPVARAIRFEVPAEEKTSYRRYPKPARFLEVVQRDRQVHEVSGELDSSDASKRHRRESTFETIAEASRAYDEVVATAREDRWRQVGSSEVQPVREHPELEAQCLASPEDPAPWAVYADWLMSQDDPCGELAASRDDTVAAARFADQLRARGVLPDSVTVERVYGFPRRATIRLVDEPDPRAMADTTRAVRTCSAGRFIDSLRFGLAGYSDRNDWAPTLRALAETPHPERIRELRFDAYEYIDCEISWATMGDLAGLFAPFVSLEVLHLKSGAGGALGELDLPALRTFIRESGGLAASEIASITTARWPRLAHLEIWFGSSDYGADSTVASIDPILHSKTLPELRHLGIVNCEWVEDAIAALVRSPLLPRLDSLDLSNGILARRGAALLVEYASAFRHLASIDLGGNQLEPDEAARIRAVLDNVIVVEQRDIDDDYEEQEADGERARYVAVGE